MTPGSVRRTASKWLGTAMVVMLAACGPGSTSVERAPEPITDDVLVAALSTGAEEVRAELSVLDDDAQEQAVILLASKAEAAAWTASGIDDAVGGPAVTKQLLDTAMGPLAEWAMAEREQQRAVQPTGLRMRSSGASSAFSTGFIAIGALADSAVRESNNGSAFTESTELPGGGATVSVDADGSVHAEMSTAASQGALNANVTAATDFNPCPDADGRLEMSADVAVRVNAGTAGGSIEFHIDATGLLDDDANLVGSNYEYRQQYASYADGQGEFLDHSGNAAGDLTANRYSDGTTGKFALDAAKMAAGIAYMVANDLQAAAERGWSSGRCVDLTLTPSGGPDNLEPGAHITIEAAPRARQGGQPTGGNIVATYSGRGSLDPTGSRLDAPATFDYVAPSERDLSGTATFESRSRRGIGTATLTLSTGGRSYTATGTRDEYSGSGTICSLEEPFTIPGNTLTFDFVPTDRHGGTWRASGAIEEISFDGEGSYDVTASDDGVATRLVIVGTITVTAPDGTTYDGPADLEFILTPTDSCQ